MAASTSSFTIEGRGTGTEERWRCRKAIQRDPGGAIRSDHIDLFNRSVAARKVTVDVPGAHHWYGRAGDGS